MRVAIIGGGLAGTACAYVLRQYGAEPVIYEAGPELAGGASGNEVGLYNPRLSAERSPEAQYYAGAFALALRTFQGLEDIDWNRCGALHLVTDEKKRMRFSKMLESWGWPEEEMHWLDVAAASDMAGVELNHEAIFLPSSGTVSPKKLCAAYARGVEVHLNTKVEDPHDLNADVVVLACGLGVQALKPGLQLSISGVRGQITYTKASKELQNIKTALCYGGYCTPAYKGIQAVGSTFQRWLDHTDILPEDDANNISKLAEVAPDMAKSLSVVGSRSAIRVVSQHSFPITGPLEKKLYVSTAHGSHGILSSLASAHILADMILDSPPGFSREVMQALRLHL